MATTFGNPSSVSSIGPTAYLPPDGYRVRFTGPTGALATEWAVDQAAEFINPGPVHFPHWMGNAGLSYIDTLAARQTTVFTNSAGVVVNREDTFMVVGPNGVGTGVEARSWTDARFYYPARLDLPTTLAAGKSWMSEGKAEVVPKSGKSQNTTYRADYQATAPTTHDEQVRRCVRITMTLKVGTVAEPPATRTWCPQLGVITLAESDGTWEASAANATIPAPSAAEFRWDAVEQLTFTPRTINQPTIPGSILASPISAPAILSDDTVVVVQKQFHDAIGLSTQDEVARSVWRARPGGTATSTATFGDLTLVTSSSRQVVAYDRFGRWVWQAPLPDQAVVAPVRVGNLAIVATLDGNITAIDLTSGSLSWTRRVPDAVRLQPQAFNDRVVVADLSNHLTCFTSDGTQQWSRAGMPANNLVIEPGPSALVVVGGAQQATGVALTDGHTQWQTPLRMSFVSLVALDGIVAVRDGNATVGLDAASGAVAWQWNQTRTYAAIGQSNALLLVADGRLLALDSAGRQIKEWPLPLSGLSGTKVMLSTGTDRVLVWSDRTVLLGVIG